jgi:hypothetical protein
MMGCVGLPPVPAEDFARLCLAMGLKLAADARKMEKDGKVLKFAPAKQEFKKLDVAAITEALKANDPQNPVTIEVKRLVDSYAAELKTFAARNGNRLPKQLKVTNQAPIEKVAMQITSKAISEVMQQAKKKSAASQ